MNIKSNVNAIKITLLGAILMLNLSANNVVIDKHSQDVLTTNDENLLSFELRGRPAIKPIKQEAFKLGQPACYFTTVGDPCLRILDPSTDVATIIECGCFDDEQGKNRHVKSPEDLENLEALLLIENLYGVDCQTNKKYRGEEESFVGKLLEKVFVPEEGYHGILLVDEYKKGMPMFWTLQNAKEFKALSTYMLKKFDEQQFVPVNKVVLVLKIENDAKLETLDDTDNEFLKEYFNLLPATDKDAKEFFEKHKETLLESFRYLSNDHKMINETAAQGIFRKVDDFWKGFNLTRLAILLGGFVITERIYNEVKAIDAAATKKITGGKETFVEWIIG